MSGKRFGDTAVYHSVNFYVTINPDEPGPSEDTEFYLVFKLSLNGSRHTPYIQLPEFSLWSDWHYSNHSALLIELRTAKDVLASQWGSDTLSYAQGFVLYQGLFVRTC